MAWLGIVAKRGGAQQGWARPSLARHGKAWSGMVRHSSPAWRSAAVLGVAWLGMVRRCEAR